MKTPSMMIAFALSLAATAATADTAQPSVGLDPLLESAMTQKPSMACPAGNENGVVHVTAQKGEFFVDFSATPHKVRKADTGWASMQDTGNPTVIAYNAACPPPVMMMTAAGLANASAPFSFNSIGASPTAAALGLGGTAAPNGGLAGGIGPFVSKSLTTNLLGGGTPGAPGATPPVEGGTGLNLGRLGGSMAGSVGSDFAGSLGFNIGRQMGQGGFLGQEGAPTGTPGAGPRLGTTVTAAAAPVRYVDGATVQNASAINLTHRGTIRASATMKATEDSTFSSGAVTRDPNAPDPSAGNPVPLPFRATTN